MLEDHAGYVIRKALMGLGLSADEAARRAGISLDKLESFFAGGFDRDAARSLARVLQLDEQALVSHAEYEPAPVHVDGIHRLNLPFGEEQVNAWLIVQGNTSLLVDTGCDGESLNRALSAVCPGNPNAVLITHGHHDHVGGLESLRNAGVRAFGCEIPEEGHIGPDQAHQIGDITFRTLDLSGHYTPALGLLFDGFSQPVLAVGDAIFAGSIGGCKTQESYRLALRNIQLACRELPDETVILPGHGPATTLGEERKSNPFLVS